LWYQSSGTPTSFSLNLGLKNQQAVLYYREVLLMQELLPVIYSIAGDVFVFEQDNARARHAL